MQYDSTWLNCSISAINVENRISKLSKNFNLTSNYETAWLLKAVTCIDLTTLSGDDTSTNVNRLCFKAFHPISSKVLNAFATNDKEKEILNNLHTAAVCVYPSRVKDACKQLELLNSDIPVASVATGFPSGQYPLHTRLKEIDYCNEMGAKEIDVVIDRSLVIANKWEELYNEINAMKRVCNKSKLKTILAVGECGSLENIYKASMIAMMAGSDFIKTSTGKEAVNATLPVGLIMCRAIKDFYMKTGIKVGLKPAGGLKTSKDALLWLALIKQELGNDWLNPKLFRIGASSLLKSLEQRLYFLAFNENPPPSYFRLP
ncbi:hypothetical protein O3M35_003149 [Rhynocoris fuscipes]|uniref:deoxyribose-phosphate aldolase n=1 Tax=Rhynocoris fuscipes TaxID=488301 RepID=A0AAW1CI34_9HEMI